MVRSIFLLFCLALMLFMSQPAFAADFVVGTGSPASCSEDAFDNALDNIKASGEGGTLTFNCGGATSIVFTATKIIADDVTIDGGELITLNGGNAIRLFTVDVGGSLYLQNITLANGYSDTDDGGAIFNDGSLSLDHTTIRDSNTISSFSGGAIVSYGPLTITNSRFENNGGGNGGALYLRWEEGDATITNSTFYHNFTTNVDSGWGGAILLWDGADVQIFASDLDGNTARYGGALHNQFGNSYLELFQGTLVRNNQAQFQGGGIYNAGGAITHLTEVTLHNNQATDFGGGVYNSGGIVTHTDTFLDGNIASAGVGGGVYSENGSATFFFSTLQYNAAMFGGGIYTSSGNATLVNTTLSSNNSYSGGGIYNDANASTELIFATLNGNVAYGEGGGIYNDENATSLELKDTIVADSEGGDCFGKPVSTALFSLWSDDSCAYLSGAGNKMNTSPLLGALADNGGFTLTHMPAAASPAIDAGQCNIVNTVDVSQDQRKVSRPQGLTCDIGAVERQSNDGYALVFLPMLSR
jgi:hypothetical protein